MTSPTSDLSTTSNWEEFSTIQLENTNENENKQTENVHTTKTFQNKIEAQNDAKQFKSWQNVGYNHVKSCAQINSKESLSKILMLMFIFINLTLLFLMS